MDRKHKKRRNLNILLWIGSTIVSTTLLFFGIEKISGTALNFLIILEVMIIGCITVNFISGVRREWLGGFGYEQIKNRNIVIIITITIELVILLFNIT